KLWCVPALDKKNPQLFSFANLIDYELVEDGVSVTKGGFGSAVVGGLAFGGVGAIVGGGLGKKQKDIVTSMVVAISVRDDFVSRLEISLIGSETKKGGLIYTGMKDIGNHIVSLLDVVFNASQLPAAAAAPAGGSADELLKYKQLLDMNAITQAEYDAKKAQLLGL
ncbi:MAG: SHOCT domain-containing protein, partial [Oscillibacter sp.]